MRFVDYISKAGTEEFDQEHCSVSDIFEIITPCLATYHLEVGAPVSLNLPTKASFGGKKTLKSKFWGYFSKARTQECDQKKLSLSDKFGMLMSGLDIYFLEVSVHALLKVANKTSFRVNKSENLVFLGYSENGEVWLK